MTNNREIVADAFEAWSRGEGYVASIFADEMTWEIVGRSRASGTYDSAQEFSDEVLHPFGERFGPDTPFRRSPSAGSTPTATRSSSFGTARAPPRRGRPTATPTPGS